MAIVTTLWIKYNCSTKDRWPGILIVADQPGLMRDVAVIPDIPELRRSIENLRIEESRDSLRRENSKIVCDERMRIDPDGTHSKDKTVITLVQTAESPVNLTSLIDRVGTSLHNCGHAHVAPKTNYRVSLTSKILALSVSLSSKDQGTFEVGS